MNIIFTYDYGSEKMNLVRNLGNNLKFIDENNISDQSNQQDLLDCDVLVCYNPFNRIDISKMKNLKLIILSSIGFDQLPLDKISNVIVTNNKGGYSIPMGEWIVLNLLELCKKTKRKYQNQNGHIWKIDTSVLELYNKKILFLGTGTIAQEGAKRLSGFSMKIVGANLSGKPNDVFSEVYKLNDEIKNVGNYDYVVCTLPHTKETDGLLNDCFFDSLKDGCGFINVSRGKLIDEISLIKALKNGKLMGACLDVFKTEPLPVDSE